MGSCKATIRLERRVGDGLSFGDRRGACGLQQLLEEINGLAHGLVEEGDKTNGLGLQDAGENTAVREERRGRRIGEYSNGDTWWPRSASGGV